MSSTDIEGEVFYLNPKDPPGPKLPPYNPVAWSIWLTIIGIIIYTILGTFMPSFLAGAH